MRTPNMSQMTNKKSLLNVTNASICLAANTSYKLLRPSWRLRHGSAKRRLSIERSLFMCASVPISIPIPRHMS
jgi:hypothetical protein